MNSETIYCRINQTVLTMLSVLFCTQIAYASGCSFEIEIDPVSRTLSEKSRLIISQIADLHKVKNHSEIQIDSYAKVSSDRAYNIAISSGYAEFVEDELHKAGVDTNYIKTRSFGQEKPEFLNYADVLKVIVQVLDCDKTRDMQPKSTCRTLFGDFAECKFDIQTYDEVLVLASRHVEDVVYTALVMNGINSDYDVLTLAETLNHETNDETVHLELNNILKRHCNFGNVSNM